VRQRVVAAGDVAPQAARGLAQLLVDQDLLQGTPALAPRRLRQVAAPEVGLDRAPLDLPDGLGREGAAVALELGLVRLQDVRDEGAGPLAELELPGGEIQIHAAQCGGRDAPGAMGRDARDGRSPVACQSLIPGIPPQSGSFRPLLGGSVALGATRPAV
jgi:hypothetical protein